MGVADPGVRPPWGAGRGCPPAALERILAAFPGALSRETEARDTAVLRTDPGHLAEIARFLREDPDFRMDQIVLVTGLHWPGNSPDFEVVYHLRSVEAGRELELRCGVPGPEPEVPSLTGVWPGADWLERETWDLVGIRFKGHPDLRRILMAEGTLGHPLRKDHPRRAPKFSMRRGSVEGLPDIVEDSPK